MQNVTRLEREIAKALGVTLNMLDVLRRSIAATAFRATTPGRRSMPAG